MDRPERRLRRATPAIAALGAVITGTVAVVGAGMPGHAQEPADQNRPPALDASGRSTLGAPRSATSAGSTVTLVTGDRVTLSATGDDPSAVTVEPAARPSGVAPAFRVTSRGDQTYVVPTDVLHLVPDRLDPALFNVSYLATNGYADSAGADLPVIFTYADDRPRPFTDEPVPGTSGRRELASVGAVAASADVSGGSDFSVAVLELGAATPAAGGSVHTYSSADAGPLADVQKVWLDAKVEALLDRSTSQISAPDAWAAGLDGSGVTVAVLDSGIDTAHPDLDQQVTKARDFTSEGDVADGLGHGTHVASIVAGSGDASDRARQGVAPGATLLNGKVIDSDGGGFVSWIIDGMEWAAAQDADVVNMSLGLFPGHVQSPMLTEAVESLSSTHDTLFVVAAGNFYCEACIGSPADAPSALTVGAVHRDDRLADFSSRGPVYETFGTKPDLTAPGVQISAARAAGTGGTAGPYIAQSGTSMATPHVAGVAALLRQAHPELGAQELKGMLMSTAMPTDGLDEFDQGAGRVDVGRAVASDVVAVSGPVDFGTIELADGGAEPLRDTVSYRNLSAQPVTLDLAVDDDVPVTVAPAQLTVQPGEAATVEVTLDLTDAVPGTFSTSIVAATGDGTTLRTPVGYFLEEEHFELTLSAIARDGRPAWAWGNVVSSTVVDVETGEPMYDLCPEQPTGPDYCIRVPEGTYSVMAYVYTKAPWAESDGNAHTTTPLNTSLVGDPELTIDADTELTLDARDAVEVQVETPAHDDATANLGGAVELTWARTPAAGPTTADFHLNSPGGQLEERFFMQPAEDVTVGSFTATSRWRLAEPEITLDVGDGEVELDPAYVTPVWFSDNSWQFPKLDGELDLRLVDAGAGTGADLDDADLSGSLALIRRSDEVPVNEQSNRAADAGAEMVAIYNDEPGVRDDPGTFALALKVPTVRLSHADGLALLDELGGGPVSVHAEGTAASPYLYDLVYAERGGISDDLGYVAEPAGLVTVERDFHAQHHGTGFSEAAYAFQPGAEFATSMLWPLRGTPRTRTDYHAAEPDVRWEYAVRVPESGYNSMWPEPFVTPLFFESPGASYRPGERHHQAWFRQPLAPGFDSERPVTRYGDILDIPIAGTVDSGGNFARTSSSGLNPDQGFAAEFQVWHDDELLGETTGPPSGTILLPPEEDEYRITYTISNRSPWAEMSTELFTEWTFRSARADGDDGAVQPLMTLDYDLGTDLANQLLHPRERRGPNLVEVTVGHQPGVQVPVRQLAFEVSYDDGRTWRSLRPHPRGDGVYAVNLGGRAPRDNTGFASFRVSAEDADGNRIEQVIIGAAMLPER